MEFRESSLCRAAKRRILDPVRRLPARILNLGKIPLAWCPGPNWGDALSPVLVGLLSGKPVVHLDGLHQRRYLAIGSILGSANEHAEVWGSGFIRENATVIGRPRAVHAVRGPLSRTRLLELDIDCPEVYGDPALLLPRFYNPLVAKRYAVGIIPHYVDKGHPWLETFHNDPQVLVLDIESDIGEFVRAVKSCEVILSSSLHGLICADAYGVPNHWVCFSDEVIGGDFKFRDYRHYNGDGDPACSTITAETKLSEVAESAEPHELRVDLKKLMLACPFLSDALRHEVTDSQPKTCGLPDAFTSTQLETFPNIKTEK
jgi:pyruvyltransferase